MCCHLAANGGTTIFRLGRHSPFCARGNTVANLGRLSKLAPDFSPDSWPDSARDVCLFSLFAEFQWLLNATLAEKPVLVKNDRSQPNPDLQFGLQAQRSALFFFLQR